MKAVWNGAVIADSDHTVVVEGNHYFPEQHVKREFLRDCSHTSRCFWKGTASYYDLEVDGQRNPAAAWFYSNPKPRADKIRGHIAFWKGVEIC